MSLWVKMRRGGASKRGPLDPPTLDTGGREWQVRFEPTAVIEPSVLELSADAGGACRAYEGACV